MAFFKYQEAYQVVNELREPNAVKMKDFIDRFNLYELKLRDSFNDIINLNNNGSISEDIKRQKMKELRILHIEGETLVKELNASEVSAGHQKAHEMNKFISLRILISNIIALASVLIALGIGIIISRRISMSIIKLRDSTIEISKGNLNTRVEIETRDEIGQLAASFNKMIDDLKATTVSCNYVDSIFNSMNSMLIIISPQGIIQTVNPFVCSTLGYQCSELIGQRSDKVIDISDLLSAQGWMKYLLKKERIINVERLFIASDERKIPALFSSSVIFGDTGYVQYIICVAQDISSRKDLEEQLHKAQRYSQGIIDSAMDMIIVVDKNYNILEFNQAAQNVFGYSLEEVIGRHVSMLSPNNPEAVKNVMETLNEKGSFKGEATNMRKDGEHFIADMAISLFMDENNNPNGFVGSLRDITENKRLEMELAIYHVNLEAKVIERTAELTDANIKVNDSLHEKEVLLREIHHRVKNNLQIVSSLLESQTRYIDDHRILAMFKDSQNRIASMALIHEKLYQSTSLSKINIAEYIKDLADNLLITYSETSSNITMNIKSEPISLNIETAIPCGLIINEIITNSLKYAFPDNRSGLITINFNSDQDNNLTLIVADNGIGLPRDFDLTKSKSLGLSLINSLAKRQLDGTIEIVDNNGTLFKISFTELQYKERF
jgi:PAS domain S-box-containing protein